MVKSSISTNIRRPYSAVTGARTTSATSTRPASSSVQQVQCSHFSLSLEGHDRHRLRGQERSRVLPGHQLGSASEGLHRTPGQSVPRALVTAARGNSVLRIRRRVSPGTAVRTNEDPPPPLRRTVGARLESASLGFPSVDRLGSSSGR